MSQGARARDGLRRAAGALAVGGRVGPELERDREHLVAGVQRELRGGGAVDPAAHRDERAARLRLEPRGAARARRRRARGGARRRRAWRRGASGGSGRRAPRRRRPGSRARRRRRTRPRPARRRRCPPRWAAPQPSASKPASTTRSPSTRTATRTRSPQAAPPAAPACGQPASAPRPRGALRWSSKSIRARRLTDGARLGRGFREAVLHSTPGPSLCVSRPQTLSRTSPDWEFYSR